MKGRIIHTTGKCEESLHEIFHGKGLQLVYWKKRKISKAYMRKAGRTARLGLSQRQIKGKSLHPEKINWGVSEQSFNSIRQHSTQKHSWQILKVLKHPNGQLEPVLKYLSYAQMNSGPHQSETWNFYTVYEVFYCNSVISPQNYVLLEM